MAFSPPGRVDAAAGPGTDFRLFAWSFAGFVAVLAILEFVGVPDGVVTFLLVAAPLGAYALIGVGARTLQVQEFYVAGRRVPPLLGGMAGASDWIGGTVLIGLVGAMFFDGPRAYALSLGLTGGFVLVSVLFAPYVRKFGAFTVPDFLAARFGGRLVRMTAILVLLACSVPLMAAEFRAVGLVLARAFGTGLDAATLTGLGVILACTALGGIRGVIRSGTAQYIVLAAAIVVPAGFVAATLTGNPFAPAALAEMLGRIGALETTLDLGAGAAGDVAAGGLRAISARHVAGAGAGGASFTELAAVALCLAAGAAAMPHVLMHSFAAASVNGARRTAAWTLGFVVLVFLFVPAVAAFAKLAVLGQVVGAGHRGLPDWMRDLQDAGLAGLADIDRNGRVGIGEITLHPDAVLLAVPDMYGAPHVLTALLLAGLLAATLSTAGGVLLAVGNTLGHDVYYRMLDPVASTAKRLVVARLTLLLTAAAGGWLSLAFPSDVLTLAGTAFSIAAAGSFPALVLAIWWKRTTAAAATLAMLAGLAATAGYVAAIAWFDQPPLPGIPLLAAGAVGVPLAFVVGIAVSLLSPRPGDPVLAFINDIRAPAGSSLMERERAAERIREAGKGR
jgi:cation/acetate symporter